MQILDLKYKRLFSQENWFTQNQLHLYKANLILKARSFSQFVH